MRHHLLAVAATLCSLLLGSGCPGPQPPAQLTLHGQLRTSGAAAISNPIHLAMGWYPTWLKTVGGEATNTFVAQEATYSGSLPADFTYELPSVPPESALVDLTAAGGTGKVAYGLLLAFEDGNGNGVLDPATPGAPSPDRIIGVSERDSSLPPTLRHHFLVYLDGEVGPDHYLAPYHLARGYTLFEIHADAGVQVVPMDTIAGLEVTRTDALQLFGCSVSDLSVTYQTSCGVDPYDGRYRLWGTVFGGSLLQLRISDAAGDRTDATIQLNGAAANFEAASGVYVGDRPVAGANTLQIDLPGHPSETIAVNIPQPIAPQVPSSARSGSTLTMQWSDDPAVEVYSVVVKSSADGRYLFRALVEGSSVTTESIVHTGDAKVSIAGIAPLALGPNGGFVTPASFFSTTIQFTP